MRDIEKYAKDYLSNEFENISVFYRRKKVLEFLSKYQPKNVLEIGCGLASIFEEYKNFDNFIVVEPSAVFCEHVKKSQHFINKVEVINDFFENKIEYLSTKEIDFIICSSLLHEVLDPYAFLKGMHQICSKDAILHVNVPNNKSFHLLWAYSAGLIDSFGMLTQTALKLQQNTTFDINSLEKICEESRFKVIEKGSYFLKPFNHAKMQQCMDNKILNNVLLDGLYNIIEHMPELGSEIFVNVVRDA